MTVSKNSTARDLEKEKFVDDINGLTCTRFIRGKELQSLFDLVNSAGFLDGETYDSFLARDEANGFITFHFFHDGDEQFQIVLVDDAQRDIGALKTPPGDLILETIFIQGLTGANEPIGTLIGSFLSIGGNNVIYTILQDLNNSFELQNNNQLFNTTALSSGTFQISVRAVGTGGTEFIDVYDIVIGETALITNINLSNLTVVESAPIGTSVGGLSTIGGEDPITYSLLFQGTDLETPVDIFEISTDTLQTKAAVGSLGTTYVLIIEAEDSRSGLPDSDRLKSQTFNIEVVTDIFLNANSLSFDGVDEILTADDSPSFGSKTKFSISVWVDPVNIGANQYITSKFGSAGQRSWGLRLNTDGKIAIVYSQTGVAADTTTSSTAVTFDAYNYIGIAFDGTLGTPEMRIYLNGVTDLIDTTVLTAIFNSTVDILIGALFLNSGPDTYQSFFQGNIDELYYYDAALSESDFDDIYNLGVPRNNETLASDADMFTGLRMGDDFTGTIQPDLKENNDFTAVNINNSNKSTDVP